MLHLYIDISVDLCFLHVLGRSPGGTLFTSTYAAGIVCLHLRIPAGLCPCLRGSWKQAQMKVKVKGKAALCHNRAPSYTCLSDVHQNILPFIFQFVTRFWNWRWTLQCYKMVMWKLWTYVLWHCALLTSTMVWVSLKTSPSSAVAQTVAQMKCTVGLGFARGPMPANSQSKVSSFPTWKCFWAAFCCCSLSGAHTSRLTAVPDNPPQWVRLQPTFCGRSPPSMRRSKVRTWQCEWSPGLRRAKKQIWSRSSPPPMRSPRSHSTDSSWRLMLQGPPAASSWRWSYRWSPLCQSASWGSPRLVLPRSSGQF